MTHNDPSIPVATILGINAFTQSNDLLHAVLTASIGFLTVKLLNLVYNKLESLIRDKFKKVEKPDEKYKQNGVPKRKTI